MVIPGASHMEISVGFSTFSRKGLTYMQQRAKLVRAEQSKSAFFCVPESNNTGRISFAIDRRTKYVFLFPCAAIIQPRVGISQASARQ